jgi:4'-phosphopantetheinyl transferase
MSEHIIEILYTEVGGELSPDQFSCYAGKLPLLMRRKINRFMRWQDRQASLFGKLLLLEGAIQYGYPSDCLNLISSDTYGRPYVGNNIDFNISHADGYVICAISSAARVGVDIELITDRVNLADFEHFMGTDQFNVIREADEPYHTFYEFWTKDESVTKADGKGLSVQFSNIFSRGKTALLSGNTWFLENVYIDPRYCCHLATDIEGPDLHLRKILF